MINEDLKVKGVLSATLYKANGEIEFFQKGNIIVNSGFDFICNAIGNTTSRPNCLGYIAVGTGVTDPVVSQSTLVTESLRKTATFNHTAGTKVFTLSSTFLPGEATAGITEAGVLNASSAGTLFDRVTFPIINKGADDTLTCQFQFTLV